ncbi:ABC transporter permease [Patescibacteria group bacterium]|nr:ABC transporter permease [Patescibacteria group bacterium]MBU1674032.1 ABC transporter permease [Patescibacteria group bacterium]MBU1963180.1 ABC transporter permease [Patescibacteria group bacterium]
MKRYILMFKLAIKGLLTNKVRSMLTILGIVIGIGAVIALMGLGTGAQTEITSSISSLGTEVATISPGNVFESARGGPTTGEGISTATLTQRDYDYLDNKTRFPYIEEISPQLSGMQTSKKGSKELTSNINGVSESYNKIQDLQLKSGRFFSANDVSDNRKVAVLGLDAADELFSGRNPEEILDEYFLIGNSKFRVVGVLESRGSTAFGNQDEDIFVPYTTASNKLFNTDEFSNIQFKVNDIDLMNVTVAQVKEKFADFRNVEVDDEDFTIFTSEDLLDVANQITSIFTTLLASIAAISLLVGGIGISNIMLVSVTERTKEIGLRKAVGAKQGDILSQFIIEAVILTLLGGIIGIIFGILMGWIIGYFTDVNFALTLSSVSLATGVSIAIGIIFGFAPAYKASKLDPIDALRYE